MSKLKVKNLKPKILIWAMLLLLPAQAIGITAKDRAAILNDTVFYDDTDYGSAAGTGGCISPLLPNIVDGDGFAKAIDDYVADKRPDSPMKGLGDEFVKAGIKYGVNPAWVVNVARKESSFGISTPNDVNTGAESYNAYGLTATRNQPYVQGKDRLWFKFESFRASIDHESSYLERNYIGKGLTDFLSIVNKYAPRGDGGNNPESYAAEIEQWVGDVVALAGDALNCDGPSDVKGDLPALSYPDLGKPDDQGYYQMPTGSKYSFADVTCPKERWGKKELLGVLNTVAEKWYANHSGDPIMIGDLNANTEEHATHKWGVGVDLYTKEGSATTVYADNYSRDLAVELGKLLLDTGRIKNIWFNDQKVIDALKKYADTNKLDYEAIRIEYNLDANRNSRGNYPHENHYHFDINAARGPVYPAAKPCGGTPPG